MYQHTPTNQLMVLLLISHSLDLFVHGGQKNVCANFALKHQCGGARELL